MSTEPGQRTQFSKIISVFMMHGIVEDEQWDMGCKFVCAVSALKLYLKNPTEFFATDMTEEDDSSTSD